MNKIKPEDSKRDDNSHEEYRQILSRRDFVSAAAKAAMIGALLNSYLGTAWAANERQIREFFDQAISTGDMSSALDRYAKEYGLTKDQVKDLSQFDNQELRLLRSLDELGFSDPERTRLADAARGASSAEELMKRAQKMKFNRTQLAGLENWNSGELDSFNRLVSHLNHSRSLEIPITDW
jgi:hypothetical protein